MSRHLEGYSRFSSSNLVGRSCGGQGNRTPQAASSRPTLRGRAQYPHRECPPKPRPRRTGFYCSTTTPDCDSEHNHRIFFCIFPKREPILDQVAVIIPDCVLSLEKNFDFVAEYRLPHSSNRRRCFGCSVEWDGE